MPHLDAERNTGCRLTPWIPAVVASEPNSSNAPGKSTGDGIRGTHWQHDDVGARAGSSPDEIPRVARCSALPSLRKTRHERRAPSHRSAGAKQTYPCRPADGPRSRPCAWVGPRVLSTPPRALQVAGTGWGASISAGAMGCDGRVGSWLAHPLADGHVVAFQCVG
jgi:hypothetical protein